MRGPKEESKKLSKTTWVNETIGGPVMYPRPINGSRDSIIGLYQLAPQNQAPVPKMSDQDGP